jgi:hypothetical protein
MSSRIETRDPSHMPISWFLLLFSVGQRNSVAVITGSCLGAALLHNVSAARDSVNECVTGFTEAACWMRSLRPLRVIFRTLTLPLRNEKHLIHIAFAKRYFGMPVHPRQHTSLRSTTSGT